MINNKNLEALIKENLALVKHRIKFACRRAERKPTDVKLLLATKTVGSTAIKLALENGGSLIGENKVMELIYKRKDLSGLSIPIHFIGHLQISKIKDVTSRVNCIHSVDRLELAQKLNSHLQYQGKSMEVLLQVNTSGEASKFGVSPEKALQLAILVSRYDSLKINGLMTIGHYGADVDKQRACFKLLKDLNLKISELALPNTEMRVLSMGTSNDLEIAIEEGSTIVRVGTAVFGPRRVSDSYYWNELDS